MTSRILYVPHLLGRVPGFTTGAAPWLAGDPRVSFDGGQPVFGTLEHATAWFAAALDGKTTGPVDLAAVAGATSYLAADGRTRVNLPVAPDQLREPHRQVAFTGPQLQPDPRVLRRQFRIAGAEAHTTWPRPHLPPRPGRLDEQPQPVQELQARKRRFAFGRGYQLGYSNAGFATHARVAAVFRAVAPAAAAAIHQHAERCWTARPPIPAEPWQPSPRLPDPPPASPWVPRTVPGTPPATCAPLCSADRTRCPVSSPTRWTPCCAPRWPPPCPPGRIPALPTGQPA